MKLFKNRSALGMLVLGSLITLTFAGNVIAASPTTVGLGTSGSFAILAGSQVTDAGVSTITGDAGVSPASGTFMGLTCAQVTGGTIYAVDAFGPAPCSVENPGLLTNAKNNLTTAYNDAAGRTPDTIFAGADNQLGGQALVAGVYRFGHGTTANLIGNLTLNGDSDDVWIFQATSDLVTAVSSSVTLSGGAQACNVFWQVGTSATIAVSTSFVGTIMADQSIALQTNASLQGRALARIAAVTLDNNVVTRSTCVTPSGQSGSASPADVGVTKTASPTSAAIGDTVSYRSVVTNHGPGFATGVAFADTLPAGETFVSVTSTQGTCSGTSTVTCAVGSLAVGGTATISIVVRMTAAGTHRNTASIGANQADQNVGANNTSSATVDVAAPTAAATPAATPTPTPATRTAAARAAAARAAAARRVAAVKAATAKRAAARRAAAAGASTSVAGPALPPVNPSGFTG